MGWQLKKTIIILVLAWLVLAVLGEFSTGVMGGGSLLGILLVLGIVWIFKSFFDTRFKALEARVAELEAQLLSGARSGTVAPVQGEAGARSPMAIVPGEISAQTGPIPEPESGAPAMARVDAPASPAVAAAAQAMAASRAAITIAEVPQAMEIPATADATVSERSAFSGRRDDGADPSRASVTIKPPGIFEHVRNWFFGGNTVARFGLLVLFFGLSFLAKYAVDNDMFPIEARLAVIGIIAFGLLGFGWRLRESRTAYAVLLQGGAVAVLYLEIFAGFKFYHLIPAPAAFGLMMLVCALATFLALRQNALSLAVAATLGGFMTPILASTGSGNHVALFSIYAVLNLSIFYIARLKTWRILYLIGFVMTFGISLIWMMDRYHPDKFSSTIGFMVLFIALYSMIPVFEARRAPPRLKHYVDGTLVFGTPTVGFGILHRLLSPFEYGIAFAALGLGAWYVALAAFGLKKQIAAAQAQEPDSITVQGLRSALVSYVALGVGFASLAIPLALNPQLAGLAWAFEGVALVWLGTRSDQLLTRFSGVALQVLGLAIFMSKGSVGMDARPFLNTYWMGATLLAVSGYFSGWLYKRWKGPQHPDEPRNALASSWLQVEPFLATLFPVVAAILVLGSNVDEVMRTLPESWNRYAPMLALLSLLAGLHALAGSRLHWNVLKRIALVLLPAQVMMSLYQWTGLHGSFEQWRWLIWPLSFFVMLWILHQQRQAESDGDEARAGQPDAGRVSPQWAGFQVAAYTVHAWVGISLLAQGAQWLGSRFAADPAWGVAALGVVLSGSLLGLARIDWRARLSRTWQSLAMSSPVPMGVAFALGLWFVYACVSDDGGLSIKPFLPLLNPIDLSASFALLSLLAFSRSAAFTASAPGKWHVSPRQVAIVLAAAGFLLLNTLLMRALSHYLDLPYRLSALLDSSTAQASFSLLWAVTSTIVMYLSSKRGWRAAWVVGAGLLALVVLKLFLVDLSALSALTRIVSFVGVGLLMLLIGYLSPLPPAQAGAPGNTDGEQA